ncbi:DMT family transporter [Streptomyces sp. 549]|uniref:DMT family transporter n=1 Tax=Streptomyces sp. 549 TaxID=3049076 RepID=UPI0024C21E94|nr:DMT family transporter [Streptomyces sp. 549]MDK1473931.1 DMT family transporter [Streptomyces sp. 549]
MWWGVAAALLANLLISIGFVVEKRALTGLPPLSAGRPAALVLHLLRSPLWILGALSLGAGFVAQLVVYRTLPLIAAQGLFVTGLVMLMLLSSVFLGEKPSGRERQSMVAIIAALVMIVFSLRGSEEAISRLAPAPVMLAICIPALATGLGLFVAAERRSRRRHRLPTAGVPYGVAVGFLYGVSSLAIKGVAGLLDPAGVMATVSAALTSPYPYLLLVTGSTGLVLSQTALQRCRASLVVPVCTTVTFLFTVAAGTIAFAEPLPEEPLRLALRLGGSLLAVSVLLMLPRHDEPAPGAEPPEPDAPVSEPPAERPVPDGHTPAPPAAAAPPASHRPALPAGRPARPDPPRPEPSRPEPPVGGTSRPPAGPGPRAGRTINATPRTPRPEGTRHVT